MKNTILLFLSLFLFSCENSSESGKTISPPAPEPVSEIKITNFTESPGFEDAKITSVGYSQGEFTFGVKGESYELGAQTSDAPQKMCANSGKGQHIHLIINDAPYAAKYVSTFDHVVSDGTHYMLAFLSRSYHESIKTKDAHKAFVVDVKEQSFVNAGEIKEPMLFYSRPKGTYVGESDTKKVMLDFYMVNADLGEDGYKVRVDVNGKTIQTLNSWKPYFIEGMPMGENTVKLTLLNKDGSVANTPLNPVERTFTLKPDPTPEKG